MPIRAVKRGCGAALAVLLGAAASPGAAQDVPTLLFEGAAADAVLNGLYEECYEAGMAVESLEGMQILCSTSLEGDERVLDGMPIADVHEGRVWHRIRFALAPRESGVRVWAYPRIEVVEAEGLALEAEIDADAYRSRVRSVLERLESSLDAGGGNREAWRERYDSRRAWRLEAHIEAVDYCDRNLGRLTDEALDALLDQAGVQPLGDSQRDRCEALYEPVYEWALARGIEAPSVEAYADYRASLPPAERCTGQLALGASCR